MFTLTPLLLRGLTLTLTLPAHGRPPHVHPRADAEPDWQQAYQRASTGDEPRHAHGQDTSTPMPEPLPAWPLPPLTPPSVPAPPPDDAAARVEPASPTVVRMADAARQVAAPPALIPAPPQQWQVELPGSAPGWQLQIQQAQPLAPLVLTLRVPPAQSLQARQQLVDLDRRLRDSGHDLLRSRLRPGERLPDRGGSDDEVGP